MERLTHRKKDGTVVYLKDNDMIEPVNMSGFDVRQVMEMCISADFCPVCGRKLV